VGFKNIIWDWNGTIIDDAWVFVDIMNSVLQKEGLPTTTLKHYRQNFCFPIQDYWRGLGFQFTDESFNSLNQNFILEYQQKMFLPKPHEGLLLCLRCFKNNNKPSCGFRQNFCFPIQDYWRGLGFQFTDESFNSLNQNFILEYQQKMFLPKPHEGLLLCLRCFKNNNKPSCGFRQNFCFPIQDYWRGLGFQFTDESFNSLNQNFHQ
jgi:outer membrane receptor for Fe3+-dicitrate